MEILLFRNACPQWTMTDSPCRHMLCPRAPKETKSIEEDEKEEKEEEQWVDIKLDVSYLHFALNQRTPSHPSSRATMRMMMVMMMTRESLTCPNWSICRECARTIYYCPRTTQF